MKVGFIKPAAGIDPPYKSSARLIAEFQACGHICTQLTPADPFDPAAFDLFFYTLNSEPAPALLQLIDDICRQGRPVLQGPPTLIDKPAMHRLFESAGLPVPLTMICTSYDEALAAAGRIGYPLIGKGQIGRKGDTVRWIADELDLTAFIIFARTIGTQFLLQEVVPPVGCDIRAFVVGDRVVAAMERFAAPGDFRANYALSGRAEPAQLTAAETALAVVATSLCNLHYAGVDFIRAPNGPVLLEANKNPAFYGIESVTGTNVALRIVEFCEEWLHTYQPAYMEMSSC